MVVVRGRVTRRVRSLARGGAFKASVGRALGIGVVGRREKRTERVSPGAAAGVVGAPSAQAVLARVHTGNSPAEPACTPQCARAQARLRRKSRAAAGVGVEMETLGGQGVEEVGGGGAG